MFAVGDDVFVSSWYWCLQQEKTYLLVVGIKLMFTVGEDLFVRCWYLKNNNWCLRWEKISYLWSVGIKLIRMAEYIYVVLVLNWCLEIEYGRRCNIFEVLVLNYVHNGRWCLIYGVLALNCCWECGEDVCEMFVLTWYLKWGMTSVLFLKCWY